MAQKKVSKPKQAEAAPEVQEKTEAVAETEDDDLDGLLEEIDDVLEEDAESFVSSYIQREDNRGAKRVVSLV